MSKESGLPQTVKQRNDLRQILHPPASDLRSYLIETDSPFSQLSTLAGDDIFVKDIQPARRAAIFSENERRARRTASAIPARVIARSYSAMISSHAVPAATISKTWSTMIRVPTKVGAPWQISGSATICCPSLTRFILRSLMLPILIYRGGVPVTTHLNTGKLGWISPTPCYDSV